MIAPIIAGTTSEPPTAMEEGETKSCVSIKGKIVNTIFLLA